MQRGFWRGLLAAIFVCFAASANAQSTINTGKPASNSDLTSLIMRQQFLAAASDINGILGMHVSNSVGQCPASPLVGEDCLVISGSTYVWYKWAGAVWSQFGTFTYPNGPVSFNVGQTFGPVANQFLTSYSQLTGQFTAAQPTVSNIAGFGANVATALGNTLNATNGLVGYSLIGTSGATLCLLNTACTWGATQTFPNNSLTLAELPQIGAGALWANPTGVLANAVQATLGSTLNWSGLTLNCTSFASAQAGCVPASGGGSANFLRADGSWIAPAGINSQSASYTLTTADCGANVVETGAFKTLTLPAAASFPANCVVRVSNGNTARFQVLSGFPSSLTAGCGSACLPIGQAIVVAISGGQWITIANPGLWTTGTPVFYVDTALGNDGNDCLAAGAAACASLNQAVTLACGYARSQSGSTTINVSGTVHTFSFGGCIGFRLLSLNGGGTALIDDNNAPGVALQCVDSCIMVPTGFTITITSANSQGLSALRGGIVDVSNNTFTSTAGTTGILIIAGTHGDINLNSGNSFAGGAGTTIGYFLYAQEHGEIILGGTQTVTGTWTINNSGCYGTSEGIVMMGGNPFSGGTVTGVRGSADTGGGVSNQASCPGNSNGSATTPGWIN